MQDEVILQPSKMYDSELKALHNENTINYFESLVKKSGIDPEENIKTVKKYREALEEAEKARKKERNARILRGFVLFVTIVFFIIGIYFIYSFAQPSGSGAVDGTGTAVEAVSSSPLPSPWNLIVGIILVLGGVGFIILRVKKLTPLVKARQQYKEEKEKEAEELKNLAWQQMAPLNELYDWNMPADIIQATTPIIKLDKYFDGRKLQYLQEKYGLLDNDNPRSSTYFVQSGAIVGNPFLLINYYNQEWVNHTYTGSLVIHWTTYERDSNGDLRTVNHTQTLYASVVKPKPNYYHNTELLYLNGAAPDLIFNREKSDCRGKTEKEIEKMVKKGEKELEKMTTKAIKEGRSFTRMSNLEFDVLFGALDRNDEIQFRMLFTPLAQQNMVTLVKSQKPYGDDFTFEKYKQLNRIVSDHSQNINYYAQPTKFVDFDYEAAKKKFVDYNNEFFKGLFFDLAPILSIPEYQMNKPLEYIYGDEDFYSNIASFEQEAVSNSFDPDVLKHPDSDTPIINKTRHIGKLHEADHVLVTAHSFRAEDRVDYVPVRGGDGNVHQVPVPWIEYVAISKESDFIVKSYDSSRKEFNSNYREGNFDSFVNNNTSDQNLNYERGLLSFLFTGSIGWDDIHNLDGLLSKNRPQEETQQIEEGE